MALAAHSVASLPAKPTEVTYKGKKLEQVHLTGEWDYQTTKPLRVIAEWDGCSKQLWNLSSQPIIFYDAAKEGTRRRVQPNSTN